MRLQICPRSLTGTFEALILVRAWKVYFKAELFSCFSLVFEANRLSVQMFPLELISVCEVSRLQNLSHCLPQTEDLSNFLCLVSQSWLLLGSS